MVRAVEAPIRSLDVKVYRIATDAPESDGTLQWDATTLVTVSCGAGKVKGIGLTYADTATARLIADQLKTLVLGRDALDIAGSWNAMVQAIRNLGRPGICSMAIAAVDNALWDLKARLLELPLVRLLGQVRSAVPVYGSGGFTSYSDRELAEQLGGWARSGIGLVKMKVGREPERDPRRAAVAREAIGNAQLFVDANGAYTRKQALALARAFANERVTWFEEPVSSDDL